MGTHLRRLAAASVMAVVLGAASTASAGVVTFDSLTATWSLVQGGTNVNFTNNGTADASVHWGTPANAQSGYEFDAAIPPAIDIAVPPSPSNDFILGTFTHFNFPIDSGTSITGVRLTLSAHVLIDNVAVGTENFVYDFIHNETPNGANPCADGGAQGVGINVNGCADNVNTNYNSLSDSFQIGPDLYTLDIRGFELLDAAHTHVLSFWTAESQANSAYVLARVALTSEVQTAPEPTTLALLGVGLLGLGLVRRRT